MPLEKSITAQGGMTTPVYDTDDDTHVNTAEALNDGDGNVKTAAQVKTHVDGNGADHANVATNDTHVAGDGSDHADVDTNNTHSAGDGSDHADVATNTTHISNDGSDHSFIDQSVVSEASPTFAGTNITTELSKDTTPQLGGDLDTNDKNIHVKLPDTDGEYSAVIMTTQTVDTNSVGVFSLLEMAADGNYDEADADAEATSDGNLVLALESGTGSKKVMHIGFVQEDDWNWTPGQPLYVSTTVGTMTHTPSSGTGDIVRCVGTAMTADMIYFNPSNDYIEIV